MNSILLIEDDNDVRANLAELLQAEGFITREAKNGAEGISNALQLVPDLIICDIMMPVMDGHEVVSTLRSNPITSTIPFIFLTARAGHSDHRDGMNLGADDYIPKPFTHSEILKAIYAQLRKKSEIDRKAESDIVQLRSNLVNALPHELITPLNGIMGYAQILADEFDTISREELKEMSGSMLESCSRLNRLIKKYLTFAEIEILTSDIEQMEILRNMNTLQPGEIVRSLCSELSSNYQNDIALHIPGETPAIALPPEHFSTIIYELIDNSLKFSSKKTPVTVSVQNDARMVTIEISNNGQKISYSDIQRIGAYMQFHRNLYEQQGSGLGLATVKRLVMLYNGSMTISSDEDGTTKVSVLVPVSLLTGLAH